MLHDFGIAVFPSRCTALREISAELITDWSDPGQLTLFQILFMYLRSQVKS